MPLPVLDRRIRFDPRSRAYAASEVPGGLKPPRSYTWRVTETLDQRAEGACVGFGWTHARAAQPRRVARLSERDARALYARAQLVDEFPGQEPQMSGTSVLAAAKLLAADGDIDNYRWAFTMNELLSWVSRKGPAVLGVPWFEGMIDADPKTGRIAPTGEQVGGHCLIANGVSLSRGTVRLHNSWGPGWGRGGACEITFDDLYVVLRQNGEACLPVKALVHRQS